MGGGTCSHRVYRRHGVMWREREKEKGVGFCSSRRVFPRRPASDEGGRARACGIPLPLSLLFSYLRFSSGALPSGNKQGVLDSRVSTRRCCSSGGTLGAASEYTTRGFIRRFIPRCRGKKKESGLTCGAGVSACKVCSKEWKWRTRGERRLFRRSFTSCVS